MLSVLFFAVLWASCLTGPLPEYYSYSPAVGSGSGSPFASSGEGRITAVRIWENSNAYINGIQLRYGYIWTKVLGRKVGLILQMDLFEDEAIIQVSGKYHPSNYIFKLEFVTNMGRSLKSGMPTFNSFNFYPEHKGAELRILSGRFNGYGITSLGAHWGMVYFMPGSGNNTSS